MGSRTCVAPRRASIRGRRAVQYDHPPALRDSQVDAIVVHLGLREGKARDRSHGANIRVAELLFALVEIHNKLGPV